MKAGWKLCIRPNDFWVQVVHSKYKYSNDVLPIIDKHRPETNLWKRIMKCWDKLLSNMTWRVSNGRILRFWKDNWVSIHDKLDQYRRGQIGHGENILVCFYANAKGNWDLEWIVVDLLANVVESIKMLKSPSMVSKTNYLEWNNVVDSGLSVKKMLISNCLILIHFKNLCCLKTLC